MSRLEVLESGPAEGRPSSGRGRARLALIALAALVLVGDGAVGRDEPLACRTVGATSWCRTPSAQLALPAVTELVHGYCPRLAPLPLRAVVAQPWSLVGLDTRRDELALRTDGPEGRAENVLLGRPGRLAWVVRSTEGPPAARELQVVCEDDADAVPPLALDPEQLETTVEAGQGRDALDLRDAGRATARAVRSAPGGTVSMGTVRCTTGRDALRRHAGARFSCELQLFSAIDQIPYRIGFTVADRPPWVRLRTPPRAVSDPHDGLPTPSP